MIMNIYIVSENLYYHQFCLMAYLLSWEWCKTMFMSTSDCDNVYNVYIALTFVNVVPVGVQAGSYLMLSNASPLFSIYSTRVAPRVPGGFARAHRQVSLTPALRTLQLPRWLVDIPVSNTQVDLENKFLYVNWFISMLSNVAGRVGCTSE